MKLPMLAHLALSLLIEALGFALTTHRVDNDPGADFTAALPEWTQLVTFDEQALHFEPVTSQFFL